MVLPPLRYAEENRKVEKHMGNNTAYSTFQHTVITIYNHGALDVSLLDELAQEYAGTDIDSGGDTGLTAHDGKTLEEICIQTIYPGWLPVKNNNEKVYANPEQWKWYEEYWKWQEICGRWGW